jgi:quinol monooxygenase YgiN
MRQLRNVLAACVGSVAFVAAPALAQSGNPVYAVTYVDVSTDWITQGTGLLKQYRDQSRREAGNLEFTVVQETGRPNRFAIMEGWRDEAAFTAHAKGAGSSLFDFTLAAIRISPPDRHILQAFATAPARAGSSEALYMVEHVDFLGGDPAIAAAAVPLVRALAAASQKEAGALRYDVYQQPPPRTNHYQVVAAWTDRNAFDAHEVAEHTRQFRGATTMPIMPARANLYDQRVFKALD